MKNKLVQKARQISSDPRTKQAVLSLKPERTIWGFIGVTVFFILPEIVAFIWGVQITAFAIEGAMHAAVLPEKYMYELLRMMFEDGGSFVNLALGIALLVWLFY